jgi:hypothetical protein
VRLQHAGRGTLRLAVMQAAGNQGRKLRVAIRTSKNHASHAHERDRRSQTDEHGAIEKNRPDLPASSRASCRP